MKKVGDGERSWASLERLHRESLDGLLAQHDLGEVNEEQRSSMVLFWHFLDPWPDSVAGLARLKRKYIIGTLLQRRSSPAD
jgi:2-haloacid dehalogenase